MVEPVGGGTGGSQLPFREPTAPAEVYDLWRKRLDESEKMRLPYLHRWLRMRVYLMYGTDSETINNALSRDMDVVRVNRAHAYVRSILPRVMFRAPRVDASPRRKGDEGAAISAGLILNYLFDELDVEREMRLSTIDALTFSFGAVKYGFDSEWGVDPDEAQKRIEASTKLDAVRDMLEMARSFAGLAPLPEKIETVKERARKDRMKAGPGGFEVDYNDSIIREMPWVSRVSPFDLLFDPVAATFNDVRWIAHRFIRPVDDARKDERYDAEQRKLLRGGTYVKTFETLYDRNGDSRYSRDLQQAKSMADIVHSISRDQSAGFEKIGGTLPDQVEIFEVWDKRTRKVVTLERSLSKPLSIVDFPFEMEGLPFSFLQFNEVPDRLYPKSDLEDIFPQNLELNDIRQLSIQWLRRCVKWVLAVPEDAVDEKVEEILASSDPFAIIRLKGQTTKDAITQLDFGRFESGVYEIEERLNKDMRETIGLSEEGMGEAPKGVTATASANAAASTDIRIEDKKRCVEKFGREIARKVLQVTRQFFPPEIAMRIAGAKGSEWRTITRDEIRREFDVKVEVDSATKPRDEVRRQQFLDATQALVYPAMQAGIQVDLTEWTRRGLHVFGIEDAEDIILGPMPMMPPPVTGGGGPVPPGGGGEGAGGPNDPALAAGAGAPAGFGPEPSMDPMAAGPGAFQQALLGGVG